MSVALEQRERDWLIRLEGEITLATAMELKTLLLQWSAAGKDLALDLERVEEIDITILQLLFATGREVARTGARVTCRASSAVAVAVRDAGFDQAPGFPIQG
jgi:anti-anti-sigma factor